MSSRPILERLADTAPEGRNWRKVSERRYMADVGEADLLLLVTSADDGPWPGISCVHRRVFGPFAGNVDLTPVFELLEREL